MDKAVVWSNKAVRILYSPESSFPSTVGQEYSGGKSRHSSTNWPKQSSIQEAICNRLSVILSAGPVCVID